MKTVKIKVKPNYLPGTWNAPQVHYLTYGELPRDNEEFTEGSNVIVELKSRKAAEALVEDINKDLTAGGRYYLAHGEHAMPEYEVVEDGEGWGEDCVEHDNEMGSGWDIINKAEVPKEVMAEFNEYGVDFSRDDANDGFEIWKYETSYKDAEYAVTYRVNKLAIQSKNGDMGNINWDNENYYRCN